MKSSTQDKVESKIHKVKGEIKEVAGKLTKNTDLEIEGKTSCTVKIPIIERTNYI